MILFSILFCQDGSSQITTKAFYFEPSLTWKLGFAARQPPPIILPYFQMHGERFSYPASIFNCSAGINFGYRFKNLDKVQMGVMWDDSQSGFHWNGMQAGYVNGPTRGSYSDGFLAANFTLIYKRSILAICSPVFNEGRFIRVHLIAGLSYFQKAGSDSEPFPYAITFDTPDGTKYIVTGTANNIKTNFVRSLRSNFGLDFTFGKNSREWFSLSANLMIGRQGVYQSYVYGEVERITPLGTQRYASHFAATGNGFYLTLSMRFFLNKELNRPA